MQLCHCIYPCVFVSEFVSVLTNVCESEMKNLNPDLTLSAAWVCPSKAAPRAWIQAEDEFKKVPPLKMGE